MRILLDTSILSRLSNRRDPERPGVAAALQALTDQSHELCLVPQVLYEYWAVATRPADVNGLNLSTVQVRQEVEDFQAAFALIPDSEGIFERWLGLVTTHQVAGRPTHDARLAAAMLVHGLDALLTRNAPDFKRFGITVLHPSEIS